MIDKLKMKKLKMNNNNKQKKYIYFTLPAIIITVILLAVPIALEFKISLTNMDLLKHTDKFVGFSNYIKLWKDTDFYKAFGRNIIYVVLVVFFNFFIGFGMAYVCHQTFFGNKVLRFLIILPMLLIPVSGALLWRFLYSFELGVLNNILGYFHIHSIGWLINPKLALFSIIFTDIWAWTPWMFLILLAGLESLEKEKIEAAQIDGAGGFQLIRYIMLPMMRPIIVIAISLKAIETFKAFDYVYVMTQGGPAKASEILSIFMLKVGFKNLRYGYASAISITVMIITIILSFYLVRNLVIRKSEER